MNSPSSPRVAACAIGLAGVLFVGLGSLSVRAASAPASTNASPPTRSAEGEETVQLKEFIVSDNADLGYSTPNAIGVSRTNEALIDTPQTINVINQQFL